MEATGFDEKLARADLVITGEGRIDAQTAFGKTALGVARRAQAAGVACIAVGGGVEPEGHRRARGRRRVAVPVTERPQTVEEAMAAGTAPARALRRTRSPGSSAIGAARRGIDESQPRRPAQARGRSRARRSASSPTRPGPTPSASSATGPGLVPYVLDALAGLYGREPWERRLDPTSELILTILTQNTADINAEVAFERLREAYPSGLPTRGPQSPASAGAASDCPRARRRTGPRSSSRRSPSWSRSSGRAASPTRRRRGSRPRCGSSARSAATTRSSSSAT